MQHAKQWLRECTVGEHVCLFHAVPPDVIATSDAGRIGYRGFGTHSSPPICAGVHVRRSLASIICLAASSWTLCMPTAAHKDDCTFLKRLVVENRVTVQAQETAAAKFMPPVTAVTIKDWWQ
jgi:hypothetical protein